MLAVACAPDADGHAMMTGHEIKSRHHNDQPQAAEDPFFQYADLSQKAFRFLVSLANRIAFLDPVRPEVVCNIENFHVGETHCL